MGTAQARLQNLLYLPITPFDYGIATLKKIAAPGSKQVVNGTTLIKIAISTLPAETGITGEAGLSFIFSRNDLRILRGISKWISSTNPPFNSLLSST